MPRKRRNPGDEMSVHEMKAQVAMHEKALAQLERDIVNEQRYYRRKQMEGTIEYHKYRIANYKEMIRKEEQQ